MDISKLQQNLKIKIEDMELFKTALTHRSYLNENSGYKNPSNERLEFLGDAVLQFLSSEFLYKKYPGNPEGDLTAYRASMVNTDSLAEESKRLAYGEHLLLSKGEEQTGGRERPYILANTFEAILGAIYLDEGIDTCRTFLEKNLFYKIDRIVATGDYKDKKSLFQEIAQEKFGITPTYEILQEWGPDHNKEFEVGVFLEKKIIAKGRGASKQKAESAAAEKALKNISK